MHPYTSTKLSFTGTLVVTRRTRSAMINDRSGSSQPPMKKAKLEVTLATTVESGLFPAESNSLVLQGEPHISIFRQSYLSISVADAQGSTAGRRGTKPYRATGDKPKERRKKRVICWMRRSFLNPSIALGKSAPMSRQLEELRTLSRIQLPSGSSSLAPDKISA